MNRTECETLIAEKLHEIVDIYHQYNTEGRFLSLNYSEDEDGCFEWFYNCYFPEIKDDEGIVTSEAGKDVDFPINRFRNVKEEGDQDV